MGQHRSELNESDVAALPALLRSLADVGIGVDELTYVLADVTPNDILRWGRGLVSTCTPRHVQQLFAMRNTMRDLAILVPNDALFTFYNNFEGRTTSFADLIRQERFSALKPQLEALRRVLTSERRAVATPRRGVRAVRTVGSI